MTRSLLLSALVLGIAAAGAAAQAPLVDKVDPPGWWAGSSVDPVRLLIHGRNLAGATLTCPRLTCSAVKANAAGSYVFVNVTIPRGLAPGSYPLTLRTAAGSATVPFSVAAALPRAGRFQGFGSDDVIYLIMPDRFADGDTANDDPAVSRGLHDRANPRAYHGGDLEGIRQHLPYLKQLGITAIWINPIYDNYDRPNVKQAPPGELVTDYHGYGAVDFYKVEEHFGDLTALRRLVDEAHRQGIRIILDMVANHTSPYHPWADDPPSPTWFNGTAAHHLSNSWQIWSIADRYGTPATRRETLDGWFGGVLPDLDQDDPEVARYLIQNTLWWVGVSGADGIRQDTWPYVPRRFWRDWMIAIRREYPRLRVVGEVLDGDPTVVSFFQGGRTQPDGIDDLVDALFDYPLYYTVMDAFARGRSLRQVVQALSRDRLYPNPGALVTFLGNHDVARFSGLPGASPDGLELAFTFLLTARGTPLVYYGDELGMPGGGDPDNRRDFPGGWPGDPRDAFGAAGRTPEQQAVWSHVQALLRLRAARPELRDSAMVNLYVGEQAWVFRRGATVVALNNGTAPEEVRFPGTALRADALGVCAPARREGTELVLRIPARKGCVF